MSNAAVPAPSILAGAGMFGALAGAVWLWSYYGTTVFFETIRTGFAVCFG